MDKAFIELTGANSGKTVMIAVDAIEMVYEDPRGDGRYDRKVRVRSGETIRVKETSDEIKGKIVAAGFA